MFVTLFYLDLHLFSINVTCQPSIKNCYIFQENKEIVFIHSFIFWRQQKQSVFAQKYAFSRIHHAHIVLRHNLSKTFCSEEVLRTSCGNTQTWVLEPWEGENECGWAKVSVPLNHRKYLLIGFSPLARKSKSILLIDLISPI